MTTYENELYHHGTKGQRWGVRRYQNYDGTLTVAGKRRYQDYDGQGRENGNGNYSGALTVAVKRREYENGNRNQNEPYVDVYGEPKKRTKTKAEPQEADYTEIKSDARKDKKKKNRQPADSDKNNNTNSQTPDSGDSKKANNKASTSGNDSSKPNSQANNSGKKGNTLNDYRNITTNLESATRSGKTLLNATKTKKYSNFDLSDISDKDLQDRINRYNLEQKYRDILEQQNVSPGRVYAERVLDVGGSVLGVTSSALGVALAIKQLKEDER